jgi:hypothetical protein
MKKALLVLAAGLAAVTIAAPAALAGGTPQGYTFITDTLAPGGGHATQPQGYTFITDTLAPGGGPVRVVTPSPSFSWPDAGVGAGVSFGSMLALLGGTLLVARRRGRLAV